MPPETRYARNGDSNIAFQIVGRGAIDLVVGLGWVSNLDAFWEEPRFARFADHLSRFARVILYDKRGTGLSDSISLDQPQTLDSRLDDLKAVITAAGSSQVALFDLSAGGAIATLFAATYPELTSKLIVFAGFARRRSTVDYPWGRTAETEGELLKQPWGSLAKVDTSLPGIGPDAEFERWWRSYLRRSAGPGTARALARLNTAIDIRAHLARVQAPALILHRTGDRVVTIENGRYLAEHIPNALLCELPGEDHLPFIGDQDQILAEIERFLTGGDSDGQANPSLTAILATEIFAATETAVRLGDRRWSELWWKQRKLVRSLIARHGGREATPTLDGSIAIFQRPCDAIACARQVIEETRSLGLHARTGIHMGEVVTIDQAAVGVALHISARVMEQAGADDVLVSGPAHDLMQATAARFDLVGNQVFPGLPGEWRVFRLEQDEAGQATGSSAQERTAVRPLAALSRREREIAVLLALGLANRQIADELVITVATVERHVANILLKLGFRSRAQVAAWAVEQGLLQTGTSSGIRR